MPLTLSLAAQQPFDQAFEPDVAPPEGLRTNRTTYSPIMDVLGPLRGEVTDEQLEQLRTLPLEAIYGALGEYRPNYAEGLQATQPGRRLVGRALTMRFLPPRPDLTKAADQLAAEGNWDRRYYARAAEEARAGDVVVAELGGAEGHILFGDVAALGIMMRGVKGAVIDGGSRDYGELSAEAFADFPVFARFFNVENTRWLGVGYNVPVRIGRATVLPGDVVVAEDEGVLFFPPELAASVIEQASETVRRENYERDLLRQKKFRFRDVYPLSPELERQYEKQKESAAPPQ